MPAFEPENSLPGETAKNPIPIDTRKERRLLDPAERIAEILFGLIMALTFTCTISLVETSKKDVKDMLLAALSCNIAWGLVDAVMYTLTSLSVKGHGRILFNFVRKTPRPEVARAIIKDELPPLVASVVDTGTLVQIRNALLTIPESEIRVRLTIRDLKLSLGIFLLVFMSTLPVALPFVLVHNPYLALRVSNLVALLLMFLCGWSLAKYGGYRKWLTGTLLTLLGTALVMITIAMGG